MMHEILVNQCSVTSPVHRDQRGVGRGTRSITQPQLCLVVGHILLKEQDSFRVGDDVRHFLYQYLEIITFSIIIIITVSHAQQGAVHT